ncbi:MAG: HEAT repeat domain-containing protein [Armatimonadota bacterium]
MSHLAIHPHLAALIEANVAQLESEDAGEREEAVRRLVSCGDAAVRDLCRVLESGSDAVRIAACRALRQLRSRQATPPLCRAATSPAPEVRRAALEALAVAGEEPDLSGEEGERAFEAAKLLARMEDRPALPILLGLLHPGGGEAFASEAPTVDPEALRQLGARQPGFLARLCVDETFACEALDEAVVALGDSGERPLRMVLKRPDRYDAAARRRAVRVLARMPDNAIPLARALSDPEASVREEAALALGSFTEESARQALLAVLQSEREEESVRACAAIALLEHGEVLPAALQRVARVLGRDPRLNERAVRALVRVAQSGALVDLNPAIRRLSQLCRAWTLPAEEKALYQEALREIQAAGDRLTDLPLPSQRPPVDASALPRPAMESRTSAEQLPRPSAGPAGTGEWEG